MKRGISSLVIVLLMVQLMIPITVGAESNNSFSVSTFELKEQLNTINSEVVYGGETESVEYSNIPDEGRQYLLVYVSVTVNSGETVDCDSFQVSYEGNSYNRELDDEFLSTHNYATLSHGETYVSGSGWLLFQIPEELEVEELEKNATLIYEGESISFLLETQAENENQIEVTSYYGMAMEQKELEATYLDQVAAGEYTPEDPFIIVNPYEIAPQSALIIFETDSPVSVQTSIIGYEPEATIVYEDVEEKIYHEIPLIGLYAGDNTVEIQLSDGTSYSYSVQTSLPSDGVSGLPEVELLEQDLEQLSEGLYMLKDSKRTLIDVYGDIRGYLTLNTYMSGIDEVTDNGHVFLSMNSYTEYPTIIECDYTGKVYQEIQLPGQEVDHDAYLIEENELLIEDGVVYLDTHEYETYSRSWSEIFNDTQGSFEVRCNGSSDWLHFNTIADGGDGYILVSMRDQHAIAKLSYPDIEVEWVLSVNEEACLNDQEKYLTPVGEDFEWFYSQHHVSMVSEVDGVMEITVFDNGMQRGLEVDADYPEDELYSRMVRYRIDQENMTVEQVWDWGEEELGTEGLSFVHGSTQYIPESDTYLGNFDTLATATHQSAGISIPRENMIVVEVNSEGEIVFEFKIDTISYRTEKLSAQVLASAWEGLGVVDGEYAYIGNEVATYDESTVIEDVSASYKINDITVTQNYIDIYGWVANPENLSGTVSSRILVLTNTETGQGYKYSLSADTSQVAKSDATSGVIANLSTSSGFGHKLLNISDLEDGTYSITLMAVQGGLNYAVDTEYTFNIGGDTEPVVVDDILVNQTESVETILEEYESGTYTIDNPMLVVNPYGIAPLSAIVLFDTEEPATIEIIVEGLDGGYTLNHVYEDAMTEHEIPIYGLYSERATDVKIVATYEDGTTQEKVMSVTGGALPEDYRAVEILESVPEEMAEGLTFFNPQTSTSYYSAIDNSGETRFLFNIKNLASTGSTVFLEDGSIILSSEKGMEGDGSGYYKTSFYQMDLTGFVYNEYVIEGVHHDLLQLENGNYLVAGNDIEGEVVEDTIYEIDATTGEIVQYWDMDEYFPVDFYDELGRRIPSEVYTQGDTAYEDWLHINSIDQNAENGDILISARKHDVVYAMDYDTGEIQYIIGDHDVPLTEELESKLLTPIDENGNILDTEEKLEEAREAGLFEWQFGQHDAHFLDNGDIIIFDNGSNRLAKDLDDEMVPATENYSRAVIYRVDEENMTVQQIWDFGQELGSECLSTFISGVQCLGEDHYLINFGGIVKDQDGNATYTVGAAMQGGGTNCCIVEWKDGEIVSWSEMGYEEGMTTTMYRAERVEPYANSVRLEIESYVDTQRLGELPDRSFVQEGQLSSNLQELTVLNMDVFDNGFQLEASFELAGVAEEDQTKLYYVGKNGSYYFEASEGLEPFVRVNHISLPEDEYHLYLLCGNRVADLGLEWSNITEVDATEEIIEEVTEEVNGVEDENINEEFGNIHTAFYAIIAVAAMIYLLDKRNRKKDKERRER